MIVLRTVRNGRVKIGGVWFKCPEPHNGKFDGMVLAFGRYEGYGEKDDINGYRPFVSLWGTKRFYDAPYSEELEDDPQSEHSLAWDEQVETLSETGPNGEKFAVYDWWEAGEPRQWKQQAIYSQDGETWLKIQLEGKQ